MLTKLHNRLRNHFGSTRHNPVKILEKRSKHLNNDITLSFIKIADARMGGNIISLLLLIRLRDPLSATIHSNEFIKLNSWRELYSLVLRDEVWEHVFTVCQSFYSVMFVFRLADS